MTADIFLRSVFFVFLGILAILQISFVYRIARIRRQTGHAPGPDQPAFSRQGSYRFALFLTAAYVFMIAFAAWEAATGRISWFLGLLLIVPALVLVRKPLRLVHTLAPTPVPPLVRLPAQPVVRDGITPSVIDEVLANPEVLAAIRSDVSMTGLIGHQETWRLGLIVRGRDEYVPGTSPASLHEMATKYRTDSTFRANTLEQVPLLRSASLYNPAAFGAQLNRLTVWGGARKPPTTVYPGWTYGLSTKQQPGQFLPIRDFEIDTTSPFAQGRSRSLPEFLREDGFPLKETYADSDPLTTERGGTIVLAKGQVAVIYPRYFVQRRLIDECGELIDIGIDDSFNPNAMSGVTMRPSLSAGLLKYVESNSYRPVLRYRSVPYASDFGVPVLDTPMSENGWADLYIDTRGKGKLFIARENTLAEWYAMLEQLRQLLFGELARREHHLLALTQDKSALETYLTRKLAILANFYIIRDWTLPPGAPTH